MSAFVADQLRKICQGGDRLGYNIRYESVFSKEIIQDSERKNKTSRYLTLLTVLCVILFALFSAGKNVQDLLIPGNAEVTRSAVHGFVDNIREGEQVKDAFAAFCLEIIENADMSE